MKCLLCFIFMNDDFKPCLKRIQTINRYNYNIECSAKFSIYIIDFHKKNNIQMLCFIGGYNIVQFISL